MRLKKYLAIIGLIGLFNPMIFAQENDTPAPILSKFILTSNTLSILGGNSSINVSFEKPLSNKRGIEIAIDYYFRYNREEKDNPINYLNTSTKNGLGILASYNFLVGDERGVQFLFGPTLGYRSINYEHELAVCTAVAPEVPASGICECLNLEQNFFTSQSRSVIAAGNIGFQSNYTIQEGGQFFLKVHANIGFSQFFPTVTGRLENVTCPFTEGIVANHDDNLIRFGQGVYTNHTIQFTNNLTTYLSLNVKLGYAF